ncbi:hypothetical protein DID88_009207 [Monilinia fructigena]|uniref:Uncharacterized protein n=1 Tax=Monilinia fructigena TaxID=38457 RepID=A0A395IFE6_9HELO|nr:hypothetical protein DID88_009207 [Monilinia fructigena]
MSRVKTSKSSLQSTKELKEKAETSLKFLEKLSGEVEGLCHDNVDEVESSAVDTSSISASWKRTSEYKVDPEKEREVMALKKKGATVEDKLGEVSPTLTEETLYPRDTMATHFPVSSSHGNDTKKKSKHVTFEDAEDKRSDLPSFELDHVSADISELEKTTEEENLTQNIIVQSGNESDEKGESCDDFIDEELIKETAEIVRRAMIHLDTDVFNDALQQASEAALGLTSEDTKNTKSLPFKSSMKNTISTSWAQAYPHPQIQATDLIRAIEILVCLTRSTPDFNAMLEDTPESEYDALAVHIIYYLDMCTNAKCLEIIEGRSFCGMEIERVQVPSFGTWWRRAQEEMRGRVGEAWGKGVLSKSVLQNVNVDEGKWD